MTTFFYTYHLQKNHTPKKKTIPYTITSYVINYTYILQFASDFTLTYSHELSKTSHYLFDGYILALKIFRETIK